MRLLPVQEIVNSDGTPKRESFTIPTLGEPSVYHEPPSLASLILGNNATTNKLTDQQYTITEAPRPQIEHVRAQNRFIMVTELLRTYNDHIATLPPHSLQSICVETERLCNYGFDDLYNGDASHTITQHLVPRVRLTSSFLVEALNGVYFAMFNHYSTSGATCVRAVHRRAQYELYPDVLLVTNAIQNSLQMNPSGQPEDGPMGLLLDLSPTSVSSVILGKDAITNASFRTKKLPDDIEVVDHDNEAGPSGKMHLTVGPAHVGGPGVGAASSGRSEPQRRSLTKKHNKSPLAKLQLRKKDDIEASPDTDDSAPPSYEPPLIVEQSKSSDKKPLKSIMKTKSGGNSAGNTAGSATGSNVTNGTTRPASAGSTTTHNGSRSVQNGSIIDSHMVQVEIRPGSGRETATNRSSSGSSEYEVQKDRDCSYHNEKVSLFDQAEPLLDSRKVVTTSTSSTTVIQSKALHKSTSNTISVNADGTMLFEDIESLNSDDMNTAL